MFGRRKGKDENKKNTIAVLAPLTGELIPIRQVNDPTFAEEMLGRGLAIRPSGNRVVSPVAGVVCQVFETGHAVTLTSEEGVEVLIHVGLDTIRLKGEHYRIHVREGTAVQPGDLLIEFDPEGIRAAGFDTVTPVVICNCEAFEGFEAPTGKRVKEGEPIIFLTKHEDAKREG